MDIKKIIKTLLVPFVTIFSVVKMCVTVLDDIPTSAISAAKFDSKIRPSHMTTIFDIATIPKRFPPPQTPVLPNNIFFRHSDEKSKTLYFSSANQKQYHEFIANNIYKSHFDEIVFYFGDAASKPESFKIEKIKQIPPKSDQELVVEILVDAVETNGDFFQLSIKISSDISPSDEKSKRIYDSIIEFVEKLIRMIQGVEDDNLELNDIKKIIINELKNHEATKYFNMEMKINKEMDSIYFGKKGIVPSNHLVDGIFVQIKPKG